MKENHDSTKNKVLDEVRSQVELCAERGWKISFERCDGTEMHEVYITATDFDKGAIVVEKIGERHLKPTLLFLHEIKKAWIQWQ